MEGKDWLLYHLTCKRSTWAVTPKNALVHLNEMRPGLRYSIMSKTGPLHAPVFSVGVEVNGFHFEGQGPTKKQAKMRAAELALRSFIQFPNASQAHATMGNSTNSYTDFTVDELGIPNGFLEEFQPLLQENEVFSQSCTHSPLVQLMVVPSMTTKRWALSPGHLSPVVLLNELRPGLRYTCLTEKVHSRPVRRYIVMVRVEGRVFEGCGHSKRLAKARAAAAALESICNIGLEPERRITGLQESRAKNQLPQVSQYCVMTDQMLS